MVLVVQRSFPMPKNDDEKVASKVPSPARISKKKENEIKAREEMERSLKQQRATGSSALSGFELEEEEDVYDVVDEQTYADVVEKRRSGKDFVVDDSKCPSFLLAVCCSLARCLFVRVCIRFDLKTKLFRGKF